ncbi:hypothetical protein CEXT_235331 [Caerostris extrusa]|uniref:Uncharacterized protein n=1 Tax=Caerostris extrusa TaxID=172846 RepID=A0AAV4Q1R2_CAEEX|nr:hypothetical protein CEXT_235331 [Caerostris extrusa]
MGKRRRPVYRINILLYGNNELPAFFCRIVGERVLFVLETRRIALQDSPPPVCFLISLIAGIMERTHCFQWCNVLSKECETVFHWRIYFPVIRIGLINARRELL